MSYLAVLGRQPEIGAAELEAIAPGCVKRVFYQFAELDNSFDLSLAGRLGGSLKIMHKLTELPSTDWNSVHDYLVKTCPANEKSVPEGKLTIGISVYGLKAGRRELGHTSLAIKKAVKSTGRSVRLVPNTNPAMSSAQVLHNGLARERGWELVAVRDGSKTHICQTVWEQDIIAYTKRDQARPQRDARVGMLPPKLAQIILNLALGPAATDSQPQVLDPFCGTGVIIQEGLLMGLNMSGTDIEPRMIKYTEDNIVWLRDRFGYPGKLNYLLKADATTHKWPNAGELASVACETTLGKPMSGTPSSSIIQDELTKTNAILKKTLINIASQLAPGSRCCFAVPAWSDANRLRSLPLIDQIEQIGYTLPGFKHSDARALIYRRPGQIVGRQLLVLIRK